MGQYEYALKSLADDQLLSGLARIVSRRNQITAEFLAYLAELDQRQLFLDLGFSSLFEYCVKTLRLCESTAGRHIAAARVCRSYPQVFALVASGSLHASALSFMKKHLTPENAVELFELCTHQSARKAEELLAARFPRPDIRDLVRRLPARVSVALDVECCAEQAPVAASVCATSVALAMPVGSSREPQIEQANPAVEAPLRQPAATGSTETSKSHLESVSAGPRAPTQKLDQLDPQCAARVAAESSKQRRFEPLSEDRYGVHFTADGEFCALLERVRGLAGHRLPSGDLLTLLKRGLEAYERELEKERFAVGGKARRGRRMAPESGALAASHARNSVPITLGSFMPQGTSGLAKSDASKFKPSASEPSASEPSASEPSASEPSASEPSASKPTRSEHSARDPAQSARQANPGSGRKRKRHYPAAVVRAVFLRDERQCTYVSPDGRRCGSRRWLELDHVEPLAVGGEATVANLRLRCRAHNQRYARQYFGTSRVDAATQACRRRRAALRGRDPGPSQVARTAERLR